MVNPNQFGSIAYLWSNPLAVNPFNTGSGPGISGATWNMWDAMTGNYILSIVNGSTMTLTEDQSGNLIGYYVNASIPTAPTLNMWTQHRQFFTLMSNSTLLRAGTGDPQNQVID
jgi:hypothetical protein